jgi:hypothetical protein
MYHSQRPEIMTTLFAPEEILLNAEYESSRRINTNASLSFSVSLNADRRRIFQVLTISEYMETWISIPGCQPDCPVFVTSDPTAFYVRYRDERGAQSALVGLYQTYRTSKTNILWRRTGVPESDTSLVRIRLNGDFERTTLSLNHSGLNSHEERDWHSQLWARSLQRLTSLFELQ